MSDEFEGRLHLWQMYDLQREGELLVVVCFKDKLPYAIRLYPEFNALKADFDFWEPIMKDAFTEPEDGPLWNSAEYLVDNMNWKSDPSEPYCFQIFCSKVY